MSRHYSTVETLLIILFLLALYKEILHTVHCWKSRHGRGSKDGRFNQVSKTGICQITCSQTTLRSPGESSKPSEKVKVVVYVLIDYKFDCITFIRSSTF